MSLSFKSNKYVIFGSHGKYNFTNYTVLLNEKISQTLARWQYPYNLITLRGRQLMKQSALVISIYMYQYGI